MRLHLHRSIGKSIASHIIILALSIVLTGWSNYLIEDGKVYFRSYSEAHWGAKLTEIKEADAESFEIVSSYIAIDKNHVFRDRAIVEGADPRTFEHVKGYFWKDSYNVYNLRFRAVNTQLDGADPTTFKVIKGYWSKDSENVYYFINKLENADPNLFKVINKNFGHAGNIYYWHEHIIEGLDHESVTVINEFYLKDKFNVYFQNKIVPGCDPNTFEVKGDGSFGHDSTYENDWGENEGTITDWYRRTYIDQ